MYTGQSRKNKIHLTDYDYASDIQRRLLLNDLSCFDVEVLREIIFNSLKFPLKELSETLEVPKEQILDTLNRLAPINLFKIENQTVLVNKELRKYYEVQIERFEEDFKPDTDYFQALLRHVPIHILPQWFSIPKSSSDIFSSIVEKYLLTPKLFTKYLSELFFDDDTTPLIIDYVYESPNLSVDIDSVVKKFSISRKELESIILILEFHKVCCLSYIPDGDGWKQILTPFYEWSQYLSYIKSNSCVPIKNPEAVTVFRPDDFAFAQDMNDVLCLACKSPISLQEKLFSFNAGYKNQLIQKITSQKLGTVINDRLHPTVNTAPWLEKSVQEKAMTLYFSTIHFYRKKLNNNQFTDKDIREIEKMLKPVMNDGWVLLKGFIGSMISPIGESEQVFLCKKGRDWLYSLPEYNKDQVSFITEIVEHHLFESGIVSLGTYNNEKCFRVTPFGQLSLGDE